MLLGTGGVAEGDIYYIYNTLCVYPDLAQLCSCTAVLLNLVQLYPDTVPMNKRKLRNLEPLAFGA